MNEVIKSLQDRYGKNADITDMVHGFLQEKNAKSHQKRIDQGRLGKFYPSSVGRCKRAVAYQMLGYPSKEIPGQNLLIMENGTSFHERMENLFEEMGIMIAPELSLKEPDLKISGRSDAIVWNYLLDESEEDEEEITLYDPSDKEKIIYNGPSNHILIFEFKSIKSKNFERLPKTKPNKNHEMQLQLYFHLTGIKRGVVYYENKDTQESKHFLVKYDEKLVQETIDYIKYCIEQAESAELPPREGNPLDIMCRYCDFRDICHLPLTDEQWIDLYFEDEDTE